MKFPNIHWIVLVALGAATSSVTVAAETNAAEAVPKLQSGMSATPAELIAMRCLICHGNPAAGGRRLAPPFGMVKMHYDGLDEAAFVKAVSAWVAQPDKAKSRMPGAVRRFGLMPAQVVSEADITAIAKYLHGTDFPMPGMDKSGMGRGPGAMHGGKTAGKETPESCDGPQKTSDSTDR